MKGILFVLFLFLGSTQQTENRSGQLKTSLPLLHSQDSSYSLVELLRNKQYPIIFSELRKAHPDSLSDLQIATLIYASYNIGSEDSEFMRLARIGEKRLPYLKDWILLLEVQYLISKGKGREALSVFKKMNKNSFFWTKALRVLLAGLLKEESKSGLKEFLLTVDEAKGPSIEFLKGKAYLLLGEKEKAERMFERIVETYPESPISFNTLQYLRNSVVKGIILALKGKAKEALKLLPYPTQDPDILFAREIALFNRGKYREFLKDIHITKNKIKNKKRSRFHFVGPISRLGYLKGFALIELRDTTQALKSWFDVALGKGKWAQKSAFMLSYYLMQMRKREEGRETFSILISSLDSLPPYLAFRLGITGIVFQRPTVAERLLRIPLKQKGFQRAQSLFWLFILTGNKAYRETLSYEFPTSYYTLVLSKGQFYENYEKRSEDLSYKTPSEEDFLKRFQIYASLGMNREALKEVKDKGQHFKWALYYCDSIRNYSLAVQISRVMIKEDIYPPLKLAFPLYNLDYIMEIASEVGVDPAIVLALMREESSFDPFAISPSWARGLTQLLYPTAETLIDTGLIEPEDLFKIGLNIKTGAEYFSSVFEKFGSFRLALAAYNAGPIRVNRWIKKLGLSNGELFTEYIPYEETRNYVRRVMRSYWVYRFLLRRK